MRKSDDVAKLFEFVGENLNDGYQEIVAQNRGDAAQARWPVLGEVSEQGLEKAEQTVVYEPDAARTKPAFFINLDNGEPAIKPTPKAVGAVVQNLGSSEPMVTEAGDLAVKKVSDLRAIFRRLESSREQRLAKEEVDEVMPNTPTSQTLSLFQRLLGA